eukprot:3230216-Prymnesium_polylepis.1
MDTLQAEGHALQARGENFTKLMGAMQQQMQQQQQQMRVMQQRHRDAMDAMQAQVIDARRTADVAAADATA